jgi:threonine/homoserine/homoserine lactone efflux protein
MKTKKRPGYASVLVFTILMALGAVLTLMPYPMAYQTSLLGYKSLCTFAPISTLGCLGMAWMGYQNLKRRLIESLEELP